MEEWILANCGYQARLLSDLELAVSGEVGIATGTPEYHEDVLAKHKRVRVGQRQHISPIDKP